MLLCFLGGVGYGLWQLVVHPETPLPDAWNPTRPLDLQAEITPVTRWQFRQALESAESCQAALETGAAAQPLPDFEASEQCHIRPQVTVSAVAGMALAPVNTRCQTALRLAMWARHGIAPAAEAHLGEGIARVTHFSSYNCRAMRTSRGETGRMSSHATADAIDISGFVTASGRQITLQSGWTGPPADQAFLRAVRDSACDWFRITLGPDYNALHADHFHLQHTGWGLCR